MVAPNSYCRSAEGHSRGFPNACPARSAWRGSLQPLQADADASGRVSAPLPAFRWYPPQVWRDGPGPKETSFTIAGLHLTARAATPQLHGGRPYFATGGGLYRPDRAGA
ncbi:MAG: hypothetical protein U0232_01680 [Thermomicrobiales bacterium]